MPIDHNTFDQFWVLICAVLVVSMQAGFTCVESGLVRAKNSINVAFKNLIDFCIASVLFGLVGFGLMFGASWHGLVGTTPDMLFGEVSPWMYVFFIFQLAFCGTATTIVSGAVAERMRFSAYCVSALVVSMLVYPVIGHWAWGGALEGTASGWLAQLGFIDFAGSTVVHSVGGWASLACLMIIGPRVGRFGPDGRPIEGHNLPVATLGVFLLWVGWFGFNGGSTLGFTADVPLIIVNTALGAAAGGIAAGVLTWRTMGRPAVDKIMNGVLAGLVAITANCHIVSPAAALLVGAVGGLVCVLGMQMLERLQIDDAVGAVPVHLFAGVWGTLAVAVCAPDGSWGEGVSRWQQLQIQALGVSTIGLYSFGVSYVLLKLVNHFLPLRVSEDDERIGLNIAEHGASSAVLDLIVQMDRQARRGEFSQHIEVEPETEAARIAMFYNAVLDKFSLETDRRQMALKKLAQLANYDTLTGLGNRRLFQEALNRAVLRAQLKGTRGAMLYIDLDDFKRINDRFGHAAGDALLKHAAARMAEIAEAHDVLARIGGDEFALLLETIADTEQAVGVAERLLAALSQPFPVREHSLRVHASVGISTFDGRDGDGAAVTQRSDEAMYTAKLAGKGGVRVYALDPDEFAPVV